MRLLYVGDVMGPRGIEVLSTVLPALRTDKNIDAVIIQAENVSAGKGTTIADYRALQELGVDGFSGGNHTLAQTDIFDALADSNEPITAPANMPESPHGSGYKYISVGDKKILLVSLLGHIVGKHSEDPTENPLQTIDKILASETPDKYDALVVNFHGDYSSEKVIIGNYLDGRASLVVGDHWHVPTADAQVLPKGTAHITDVGMVGALDASLGVTFDSVIPRWRDGLQTRNVLENQGRVQFNAVLVDIADNGRASSIEQIRVIK